MSNQSSKGQTPYEAWHGEKPKVNHLRVFGCDSYTHISKDERGKLDMKARKCLLLGYGDTTKGYRLYDPVKDRVIHSRDVRFNEIEKMDSESDSSVSDCDHVNNMIIEHNITSDNEETNEEEVDDLTQPPSAESQTETMHKQW